MTNEFDPHIRADAHALAGPYALDALLPEEQLAFEIHLATCDTCPAEVEEFRATAARLGAAADAGVAVPPSLRARVLAEIAQTRQASPLSRRLAAAEAGVDLRANLPARRRATPLWRRPRVLAAAAAFVVLAGGAGISIGVAATESKQAQLADQARDELTTILAAPDSITTHANVIGGGRVTLTSSPFHDAAVAVFNDLPANPDNRSYQLWMMHGTTARSMGVMHVAEDGPQRGKVTRVLRGGIVGANGFGLTVEPAAGSRTPTLPTIAQIPFT